MVRWDWLLVTIWSQPFLAIIVSWSVGPTLGPRHPPLSHNANGQTHAFNSTTVPKLTPQSQSVQDRGSAMTLKHKCLLKWKSHVWAVPWMSLKLYTKSMASSHLKSPTNQSLPKTKPMHGKGQNCAFNVVVVVVVVMSWGCTISKGREGIVIHWVDLWTLRCSA